MDDILQRDQNHVTVLGAVTDDSNRFIRPLLADKTTGRLLVSAVVAGTENGKLRVDGADTLYDYLANKVESLDGSIVFTIENPGGNEILNMQVDTSALTGVIPLANGGTGTDLSAPGSNALFGYDTIDGESAFFALGAGLSYDHTTHTLSAPGSGTGYDLIQIATIPLTERNTLNFSDLFTGADNSGNASTDIDIDVSSLASNSTFVTDLSNNTTFVENIANNTDFITTLSNNSTFVTDLTSNTEFISNVVENITISGGGIVQTVTGLDTDNTDPANPVIEISVDGVTITGDGTPGSPLIASPVTSGQVGIQFDDESGSPLGSSGTVDEFEITGPNVTAGISGDKVTYTIGSSSAIYKNGTTTKNAADASATQTIAHGLGSTPKSIEIICSLSFISTGTSVTYLSARSFYNGSTQSSQSNFFDGSGGITVVTDNSTFSLNSNNASSSSNWTVGTITFDATNIYIAWVKTGSASGNYQILWKANT